MNDKKHSTVGPFDDDPLWDKYTDKVLNESLLDDPNYKPAYHGDTSPESGFRPASDEEIGDLGPTIDADLKTVSWGKGHYNGSGPWALELILNPTDQGGGQRIKDYVGFDEEPPPYFDALYWIDHVYMNDEFPINNADRKHVWRLDPDSQQRLKKLEASGQDRNTIDNAIDHVVKEYKPTRHPRVWNANAGEYEQKIRPEGVELVRVYNKQEEAKKALDSGMHPGNERFGKLD